MQSQTPIAKEWNRHKTTWPLLTSRTYSQPLTVTSCHSWTQKNPSIETLGSETHLATPMASTVAQEVQLKIHQLEK